MPLGNPRRLGITHDDALAALREHLVHVQLHQVAGGRLVFGQQDLLVHEAVVVLRFDGLGEELQLVVESRPGIEEAVVALEFLQPLL